MIRVLFALCGITTLVGAVLVVVRLGSPSPEECCAGPVAGALSSPSSAPLPSREAGQPQCAIGAWRSTEEVRMVRFYNDEAPIEFTGSGRTYVYRPDGTATERNANYVLSATWNGRNLRMVHTGERQLTWSMTGDKITYPAITATTLRIRYYDHRGLVLDWREPPDPALNEVDTFTCAGRQAVDNDPEGNRAVWARTIDYGVYG